MLRSSLVRLLFMAAVAGQFSLDKESTDRDVKYRRRGTSAARTSAAGFGFKGKTTA